MQFRDIAIVALAALAIPAVVQAADAKETVDRAKAVGQVGEQFDGFLGFVTPVSDPALKAAVAEINAGRAALYREAAAKNGVTPEAAGMSAFNTIVQAKLKPGEYYKASGGSGWVKK